MIVDRDRDRDRDRANAERVAAQLDAAGGAGLACAIDLAETAALPLVPRAAIEQFGRLDILVNAAGVSTAGIILETSIEDWQWVHAVNLTASFVLLGSAIACQFPPNAVSTIGVSVTPRTTAFTVMACRPRSPAAERVSPISAALELA